MRSVPTTVVDRGRRRVKLMRVLAVCLSTVVLAITLVAGGSAETLGALFIWVLTLLALALGVRREFKSDA